MDESAVARWHLQAAFLIDNFASGDGDDWDAVALHALKDVVIHSLVMGLGWYLPITTKGTGTAMKTGVEIYFCTQLFANNFAINLKG